MKRVSQIINGKIYYNGRFMKNGVIFFDDEILKILDINKEAETYKKLVELYKNEGILETINATGQMVLPGLIDIHIHGYKGVDVMDGNIESLESMKKNLTENGVTSFLATTMTMDKVQIIKALDAVAQVMKMQDSNISGAEILGVHLEGPFINEKYKGAQSADYIIGVDLELFNDYKDIIKIATIAPEKEGNLEAIKQFGEYMKISIGHSGATYKEAKKAFKYGACGTTHLFNGMTGMNHREPGIVGAAFTSECYSEIIADNIHIHPDLYQLVVKAKGMDKILLITDCMQGGGLNEGTYSLGGQEVIIKNGRCSLTNGTLAGSVLKLNQGLKNFTNNLEETLEQIIPTVTINQAKYLNIDDKYGSLDIGKRANIAIMDKDFMIQKTIVKGKIVYEI